MDHLPEKFIERLQILFSPAEFGLVVKTFDTPAVVSVRINTLKADQQMVMDSLTEEGVAFSVLPWNIYGLIINNALSCADVLRRFFDQGWLYRQGLASMLPVVVLDPQPGEEVLDMCAAPGSKTTQMAALMQNQGRIVALEVIRSRFYKLRAVCTLLGAENVDFRCLDARRYRAGNQLFDKILVDAPCSSEGRFKRAVKKTYAYWSPRKIKEMVRKQRGLLLSATRLLKPGGTLVYSTCTFAPEENEGVVDWVMRKTAGEMQIEPADLPKIDSYSAVQSWQGREYNTTVSNCFRVFPQHEIEGFFVTKFVKMA